MLRLSSRGAEGAVPPGREWSIPAMWPDMIEACGEIRRRSRLPITTGEHEYTRSGIKLLLDAGAVDVLKPDSYCDGGVTASVS